jgi:hypothetical protein
VGRGEVRADVGGIRVLVKPLATGGGGATIGRVIAVKGDIGTEGTEAAGSGTGEDNRAGETRAEVVCNAGAGSEEWGRTDGVGANCLDFADSLASIGGVTAAGDCTGETRAGDTSGTGADARGETDTAVTRDFANPPGL